MSPTLPPGAWIQVARLGGIRFYVEPVLLLVMAFVALLPGGGTIAYRLAFLGVLLLAVLVHELGHVIGARLQGLAVTGVFLHVLPFAYVARGAPREEIRVALAGPAASLSMGLAGLVGLLVFDRMPADVAGWFGALDRAFVGTNLLMGTLNLLPLLPLDGGRALHARVRSAGDVSGRADRVLGLVGIAGGLLGGGLCLLALGTEGVGLYGAALGAWLAVTGLRSLRAGMRAQES